jgi:hypothetical protein
MQTLARILGRYCLRFLLCYWICFSFPFPLDLVGIPLGFIETEAQPAWLQAVDKRYSDAYKWTFDQKNDICKWVGDHILHVEVIIQPTGSGDSMRAYVCCLCALGSAAALALLWSQIVRLLDWCKPDWQPDAILLGLVRVLARFFLVEMLFSYGFAKVIPLQFPQPSSSRLAQQVGDMSPMGLLWTFMGFSPAYEVFTGVVEVLGGLLLTTRRTTLLGSLVTIAAMGHVFILNMCFDVPVKLYSLHYLLMALFLAAPELPRLARVLVLGRATEAQEFPPLLGSIGFDRFALAFRTLVVLALLVSQIQGSLQQWNNFYGGPPLPLHGRWDVVSMRIDEKEPDKDDPKKWNWLDFTYKTMLRLGGPTPPNVVYRIVWQGDGNEFSLSKFTGQPSSGKFNYELPEPDKLELRGSLDGKTIAATLKPAPDKRYELMNRGFHWIQELPYNR